MKSRPILFSAPMVSALLAGTKTQTRRIIKGLSADVDQACGMSGMWSFGSGEIKGDPFNFYVEKEMPCPYGVPGDRLWVRERFSPHSTGSMKLVVFAEGGQKYDDGRYFPPLKEYAAGAFDHIKWKPSIHMPRWASRITLEITGVRVERLQGISEVDAKAEGIPRGSFPVTDDRLDAPDGVVVDGYERHGDTWHALPPVAGYRALWESINGPGSWDANPWVWVVEFKRAPDHLIGGAA